MPASRHKPTKETRDLVQLLVFAGQPQTDIAIALCVDMATLREHYMDDLLNGAVHKRTAMIARLEAMSVKGSVPACRMLLEMNETSGLLGRSSVPKHAPAASSPAADPGGDAVGEERVVRLGKKEAIVLAAHNPDRQSPMGDLMARRMAADEVAN